VADEDGVVVVPQDQQEEILRQALAKADQEDTQSLDDWEAAHRARIDQILSR
jgi:4-hydroxy-4-methyl-2-oxoglutarate aldolase